MGETIGFLLVGFIFLISFGDKKTKRQTFRFIRHLTQAIVESFQFNYKLLKWICRNLNKAILHASWNLKFKGIKTPEQVRKEIRRMQSREFEIYCAKLFKKAGYEVKLTPDGNDYGRDIILKNENNETIYVECKRWEHNNGYMVGREICEKLIGSCAAFNVTKSIIINTGDYHSNAFEYTSRINKIGNFNIDLWNTEDLINLYKQTIKQKETNDLPELN